jgi:hypothetical protein
MERLGRIILVAERVPEPGLAAPSFLLLEIRMRSDDVGGRGENLGEVAVPVEQQDRGLRVPPRQVTEKLVNSLGEPLWSAPKLTFGDKYVAIAGSNQNVRLALIIECFAGA